MRGRSILRLTLFALAASGAVCQSKLPVQQAIEAQFPVTKATFDHKDMVTPGAVIDLLKDNLVMSAITEPSISTGTYKDGKFQYGGFNKFMKFSNAVNVNKVGANRTFVAGEKFWLIGVTVNDDAAVLEFLSDPIADVRYKAFVKYPFPKGSIPPPDVVLAAIKESIKAEPTDQGNSAAAAPAPAAPAPAAPEMAPIAPPPPPTDAPPAAPKSIALGQTKDQVAATFGPPTKIVKLATKEIDYYPDMKVTFVNGKVTDVQ